VIVFLYLYTLLVKICFGVQYTRIDEVPHVYSVSPFAIKLESFFRINNILYEPVFGAAFGSKGMIPYIKFDDKENGEEVPDSNVIINHFKQTRLKDEESFLSAEQRAMSHAVNRMLEEHTIQVCFYYRYGLHMSAFLKALDIEHRFREGMAERWERGQPEHTRNKTKMRGLTRHTDEELWGFSNDDIQAISDYLGKKKYFFGDRPTTADCTIFGHLSQFLWIPIDFPQKEYMKKNCPNVVEFMNRFKKEYWPDWEELCARNIYEEGAETK